MKAKLHKDIKSSRDFGDRIFELNSKDFYKSEWELLLEIYDSLVLIETGQRLFGEAGETAHWVANLPINSSFTLIETGQRLFEKVGEPARWVANLPINSSFTLLDTNLRTQEIQSILIAGASRLELLLKLAPREVEGLITFEEDL